MKFNKVIMANSGVIFYERDGRIVLSGDNDGMWIIWDGGLCIARLHYDALSEFTKELMKRADESPDKVEGYEWNSKSFYTAP